MVSQRFVAIFFPPAQFDVTTRTTLLDDLEFKTEGKVLVEPGYLQSLRQGRGQKRTARPSPMRTKTPPGFRQCPIRHSPAQDGFKAQNLSMEMNEDYDQATCPLHGGDAPLGHGRSRKTG
jgi:hypothetical protein